MCSGTLVGGKHPDVVLTAAHCVTGGPGKAGATQWATNWMFVPGFVDGLLPYGEYTARRFFVSKDWTGPQGRREQYDAAFVQVTTATLYGVAGAAQPPPACRSSSPAARTRRRSAAGTSSATPLSSPTAACT